MATPEPKREGMYSMKLSGRPIPLKNTSGNSPDLARVLWSIMEGPR